MSKYIHVTAFVQRFCCELISYLPSAMDRMQHNVNFSVEYSWFDFRVFFLQNWLLYKEFILPYCLHIARSGGEEQMDSCLSHQPNQPGL